MTVEEEIRKHAKTAIKIDLDFPPNLPNQRFMDYGNRLWVPLDVVLGIVAKAEAERNKQLQQFLVWLKDWTNDGIVIAKFEAICEGKKGSEA